jgi:hypothetical protein
MQRVKLCMPIKKGSPLKILRQGGRPCKNSNGRTSFVTLHTVLQSLFSIYYSTYLLKKLERESPSNLVLKK